MSSLTGSKRSLLVAAPMAIALLCGALVLVGRNQSEASGFCTAYQAALTETIQRSGPISGSPTPDDAVRLFVGIDIEALQTNTPPELQATMDHLVEELPKLRAKLADLKQGESAIALVPPEVIKDVETLGNAFSKQCQ